MRTQDSIRKIFTPVIVVLFFVGVIMIMLVYNTMREHPTTIEIEVVKDVPDFTLTNQFHEEISRDDLLGYFWIVNFIFTNCGGTCPVMTFQMHSLQNEISSELPVRFVSITVDPERDTPDVLHAYAEEAGADQSRWFFLTGETEKIYNLAREGFLLGVDPEGGTLREPIMHSQRFVLVDADGMIRGYYDGFDEEQVNLLNRDLYILLGEAPEYVDSQ